MPQMNGQTFFADSLSEAGVTHAFFVPAMLFDGLGERGNTGIRRIMVHGEKAASRMPSAPLITITGGGSEYGH